MVVNRYRYRPALFFIATGGFSWIAWAMAIYLEARDSTASLASLFNLIGLLGPLVVGLGIILTSGSPALKRDLADRLVTLRRIRPPYLALALVMPLAVLVVSIWLSLPLGEPRNQLELATGGNLLGTIVLTMVLAPVIEELGWRGYGVDSLRAKMGVLKASLVFGVLWSLWHAPLVLVQGTYHYQLAQMPNPLFIVNFFVGVVPAAVLANWLYYKNDRSIVAGVFLHAAINGAAVLLNAGQVAKTIASGLYVVIAVVVVMADRSVFGGGPRDFLSEPTPPSNPIRALDNQ